MSKQKAHCPHSVELHGTQTLQRLRRRLGALDELPLLRSFPLVASAGVFLLALVTDLFVGIDFGVWKFCGS